MGGEVGVRPATAADWRTLASVLARAFYNDPFMEFSLPDVVTRLECAEAMFLAQFEAYFEHVGAVTTTTDASGAAVWSMPEDHASEEVVADVTARMDAIFRDHGQVIGHALAEIDRSRPDGAQVYLDFLGTDPKRQRHGIGTALVNHVTASADDAGLATTLWTATDANIAFYKARGFDVSTEVRPHAAPRVWWMKRDARRQTA